MPRRVEAVPVIVYHEETELRRRLLGEVPTASAAPEPADAALLESLGAGRPFRAMRAEWPGPWRCLVLVDRAPDSQWDRICDLAAGRRLARGGLLCVAGSGEGFHGQGGRPWVGVPGNLHLTVRLQPDLPARELGAALSALPAVAVVEAVDRLPGLKGRASIRWVNDVVLGDRKVAGVLTRTQCQGERVEEAVLGLGVNVETRPEVDPDLFTPAVTSLRHEAPEGAPCSLGLVFRHVCDSLAWRMERLRREGPAGLVEAYRRRCMVVGRTVRLESDAEASSPPAAVEGRVTAIGDDLELFLEGRSEPVRHGRLRFVGREAPLRRAGDRD